MKKQAYPIANLTGGLTLSQDPVFLADTESPNLASLRFHQSLIKTDFPWISFANANEYVMAINEFPIHTGVTWEVVHTPTSVYRINANHALTKLNTGGNYTGNEDDMWDYICTIDHNGNEVMVFTNGVDRMQKWDGVGATCANLGGWANITARYVNSFRSRLFCAYTVESGIINPTRVQWSVVGNIEDSSNTGSGFFDLYEGTDPIMGLWMLKDRLLVMRQESIWEILYVGGNNYFQPVKVVDSIGCVAPRSVCAKKDALMFLGFDNVYVYDGTSVTPIGNQLAPWLFESEGRILNADQVHRACGIYVFELDQYWLNIPTDGDYPDTVFKYDFKTQSWTRRPEHATTYGYWYSATTTAWQDLTTTWANWAGPWMTQRYPSKTPTILRGAANGEITESNFTGGATDTLTFETKDWLFGHACRIVDLRVQAKGGPFTLSYSLDSGNSWSTPKAFTASNNFTEHSLPLNITTQHIRARIQSNATNFQLKWIEPWYITRKRSKLLVEPS